MPAGSLREPGRRVLLRQEDAEPPPSEQRYAQRVDAAVREAAEQGAFSALPGQGRPQVFADGLEALVDPEWLVHHVLKNAGYAPPFAALGRGVEAAREASARLEAAWLEAGPAARAELRAPLEAAWDAENALLRRFNREAPSPTLQRYPLPVPRRWVRLGERAKA